MQASMDFDRVEAKGLVKMYGATRALAGVDLAFVASTTTVLEGPNGAGKSTMLALLAQLARPTRGAIAYGSHQGPEARSRIGVLAHAAMLYPDLSGRENLRLFAELYGLDAASRVPELLERFEIGSFVDRPVRTYSRGQMQRTSLARALVHSPRLLLLDEPSTGLDVRGVERLAHAVEVERARGAIVVLVTHDVPLAERLATRRVVLERGRVKADAS